MIPYYKKLNIKIPNLNIVKGKIYDSYGVEENNKFLGVKFSEFFLQDKNSIQNFNKLLEIIPNDKRQYFSQRCMTVTYDIYPHIDDNINSTVNIYLKVNGGKTTFHEKKSDDVKDIKELIGRFDAEYDKDSTSEFLDFSDVKDICYFTAEVGDVYIINTDILHSVSGDKEGRSVISLQSTLPINEVVQIFKGV
jgi:hypothetical protein|tara:strand:+ start:15 stop:593 length:579 start_codon:yes stop_codon:yes gene_type:complete